MWPAEHEEGSERQEEGEAHQEEAREARPDRDACTPSREEQEQRMLSHLPYRACCPWRVAGRWRRAPQRRG